MLCIGTHELTLDEKKRLSIPAAIRNSMDPQRDGTGFYIVLGERAGTLALYPNRYFWDYADRTARELEPGDEQETFEQVFYSQCAELEVDKQGRVILPEHLVTAVNLGRTVCLTGARDHLLLWNKGEYEAFIRENRSQFREMLKRARRGHARMDVMGLPSGHGPGQG